MPLPVTFRDALAAADRPLIGMWCCSGSPLIAEICAGSGLDWLLIDGEHGPNDLGTILTQLQAAAAYPVTTVVRVPSNDAVVIKQVLDLGAQNLLVPMVGSAEEARAAGAAVRCPPGGSRGVGWARRGGGGPRWRGCATRRAAFVVSARRWRGRHAGDASAVIWPTVTSTSAWSCRSRAAGRSRRRARSRRSTASTVCSSGRPISRR